MWSRDLIASRIGIAWCLVLGAVKWGKLRCGSCVMPWVSGRWCWPGHCAAAFSAHHSGDSWACNITRCLGLQVLGTWCRKARGSQVLLNPQWHVWLTDLCLAGRGFGCCELASGCAHVWLVSDPSEVAEFTPLIPDCPSRSSFAAWDALAWQTVMLRVYGSLAGGGCYPTGKRCPF